LAGTLHASQGLQGLATVGNSYSISSFTVSLDGLNFALPQEPPQNRMYLGKKIRASRCVNLAAGNQDIANLDGKGWMWISCSQDVANLVCHSRIRAGFKPRKCIESGNWTVLSIDRLQRCFAFSENSNLLFNRMLQALQPHDLGPDIFKGVHSEI
jgi:hypothetical protein